MMEYYFSNSILMEWNNGLMEYYLQVASCEFINVQVVSCDPSSL